MTSAQTPGSPLRRGVALLAQEPWVAAASVFVVTAIAVIGMMAVAATHAAESVVQRLIGATAMLVVLDPKATQEQIEAAGVGLRALQSVASIRLVDKAQAIVRLSASARGAVAESGDNPLPSVWVVHFAVSTPRAARLGVVTAAAREAASALPGVETVRVDDDWIALLDRAADNVDRIGRTGLEALFALFAVVLFGTLFLAGRVWGRRLAGLDEAGASAVMQVSACLGAVTSIAGVALAAGITALTWRAIPDVVTGAAAAPQTFVPAPGLWFGSDVLVATGALFLCSVVAASLGGRALGR